jgi:hypothetical protein
LRHFPVAYFVLVVSVSSTLAVAGLEGAARADEATDQARRHYETGLELFYAREHAQALIEFQHAHEVKPRPATLFMMGQCEYLLGQLRQARDHYDAYLHESPTGEFVEVAKDRIEAINRRPATLVISTVPDQVDVTIAAAPKSDTPPVALLAPSSLGAVLGDAPPAVIAGQAPNNFAVPRGRWVVTVSKPNYVPQRIPIEVEVADTKQLFFKLEPVPARLEIETVPTGATLYVNGNRARNPYHQNVPPGRFEIFAEATDYEDRSIEFTLGPGEKRLLLGVAAFPLRYVQRSGRPELLTASAVLGGLVGAGAVAFALRDAASAPNVSSVGLLFSGAVVGAVASALVANNAVPAYVPDNRALFVLGGMWIGAADGALTGMIIGQTRAVSAVDQDHKDLGPYKKVPDLKSAAFVGSLPGLAIGITTGALLSRRAPTYGRVALIQSAAIGGAVVGGLTAAALQWNPFGWQRAVPDQAKNNSDPPPTTYHLDAGIDPSIPALIGLNVGLAAGLLGAYLPDQSRYGPSWKRVGLVDLAAGAGALAGAVAGCVSASTCAGAITAGSDARAKAAGFALLGGGVGLVAGILLTSNVDRVVPAQSKTIAPPSLTLLPLSTGAGQLIPALGAIGFF